MNTNIADIYHTFKEMIEWKKFGKILKAMRDCIKLAI